MGAEQRANRPLTKQPALESPCSRNRGRLFRIRDSLCSHEQAGCRHLTCKFPCMQQSGKCCQGARSLWIVSGSSDDRFIANPFSVRCINQAAGRRASPCSVYATRKGHGKFCLIARKLSLPAFIHSCIAPLYVQRGLIRKKALVQHGNLNTLECEAVLGLIGVCKL